MNGDDIKSLDRLLTEKITSVNEKTEMFFKGLKDEVNFLRVDTHDSFIEIKTILKEHEIKLDSLNSFKWKIIGGAVVLSAFLSGAVSVAITLLK